MMNQFSAALKILQLTYRQKSLDREHYILEEGLGLTDNQRDRLVDLMYNFKYDQDKIDKFLDEVYEQKKSN